MSKSTFDPAQPAQSVQPARGTDDAIQDRSPAPAEPGDAEPAADPTAARRAEAIKRLEKKRGWTSGFVAYLVVNAFLIGIWATTGQGYFWPGWVLGGWGLGVVLSYWDIFVRRPITDRDIDAELRRR